MTTLEAGPAFPLTRRTWRAVRWVMLAVILFGPIAQGAWAVHASASMQVFSREVPAPPPMTCAATDAPPAERRVSDYLERRNPAVDRLLPEGRGGTHFFEDLGPKADGLAFAGSASIALSVAVDQREWPESAELHERAHLVDAFLPDEVAGLMARLAPAAPDEYAATNHAEHFGEMAAKAWEIVAPAAGFCMDGLPAQRLEAIERRVPGTSGFVLRYLAALPVPAEEGGADLRATAERLSAPFRHEWTAIWNSVDARRQRDGTFDPWPAPTVRSYLEARRSEARRSDKWADRIEAVALLPSLLIVRAAGG